MSFMGKWFVFVFSTLVLIGSANARRSIFRPGFVCSPSAKLYTAVDCCIFRQHSDVSFLYDKSTA